MSVINPTFTFRTFPATTGILPPTPPATSVTSGVIREIIGQVPLMFLEGNGEEELGVGVPGPVGATGPAGSGGSSGAFPAFFFEPVDGEDGLTVPGARGSTGTTGSQGLSGISIPGINGEDGEDGVSIPGSRGTNGSQGSQGVQGQSIFVLAEDPEEGISFPGPKGDTGLQGIPGSGGSGGAFPAIFNGEDGEEGMMGVPGLRGATGASGGGGGAVTAVTLTAIPFQNLQYAEVTVIDAAILATSKINIWPGNVLETDENSPDMENVFFNAVPGTGSMVVRVSCTGITERLGGVYKINYSVG
jgi:hypothetical protein